MTDDEVQAAWREAFKEREQPPICASCNRPILADEKPPVPGACWACGR